MAVKPLVRATVKHILENAPAFKWSLQGLGMLRCYLSTETRLHVWSSEHGIPNASRIHDHPWNFISYVVAGRIQQHRYEVITQPGGVIDCQPFMFSVLQCGPGGCIKTPPAGIYLRERPNESYGEGESYEQEAEEIHNSLPLDGTVTLVTRTFKADTEHARVFWPYGTEWVSAEPRTATIEEVKDITANALRRWFV